MNVGELSDAKTFEAFGQIFQKNVCLGHFVIVRLDQPRIGGSCRDGDERRRCNAAQKLPACEFELRHQTIVALSQNTASAAEPRTAYSRTVKQESLGR